MKFIKIIGISLLLSGILYYSYRMKSDDDYNLKYEKELELSGVIDIISTNVKGSKIIVINDSIYYLSAVSWTFKDNLSIGDSILKKKNGLEIIVVKAGTGERLLFK